MFLYGTLATIFPLISPPVLEALSHHTLIPPTRQSVRECVTPPLSLSALTSNAPVKRSHPANYPQSHVGEEKHPDDVIRNKSSTFTSWILRAFITIFLCMFLAVQITKSIHQIHGDTLAQFLKTSFHHKQYISSWSAALWSTLMACPIKSLVPKG